MTDKILFFIDLWFTHFGIAKSLHEKHDCELYAIIDCDDKAKKFFLEQNLVKFSKVWYYLDCFKNKKMEPDLNYLKNFEEKYNINLWSIAYAEREFYLYNQYYKFSEIEILSILENECKLFEQVLNEVKPDFLFLYMTTTHYHHLLHTMCRKMGIKVLLLGPLKFKSKMMISEDPFIIDKHLEPKKSENTLPKRTVSTLDYLKTHSSFEWIKEKQKISFETNKWKRYKSILKFFLSRRTESFKIRYSNQGRTRKNVLLGKISNYFKRRYRESFVNSNFSRNLEGNPFVYFPLHYEPERVLLIDAAFHDNQLQVISNIAKSLPIGYDLFVKEHPMMNTVAWRPISYYKFIMNLPNVKLIHPSIKPEEILSKCSLVVTIAGTAGQEAAFYNKPSIILTDQIYSSMLSVYRLRIMNELPNAIRNSLKNKVDSSVASEFVDLIEKNSIDFDVDGFGAEFAYKFGFKGPIMDAELQMNEVESFMKEHKTLFDNLALEHIKKIEAHKATDKLN